MQANQAKIINFITPEKLDLNHLLANKKNRLHTLLNFVELSQSPPPQIQHDAQLMLRNASRFNVVQLAKACVIAIGGLKAKKCALASLQAREIAGYLTAQSSADATTAEQTLYRDISNECLIYAHQKGDLELTDLPTIQDLIVHGRTLPTALMNEAQAIEPLFLHACALATLASDPQKAVGFFAKAPQLQSADHVADFMNRLLHLDYDQATYLQTLTTLLNTHALGAKAFHQGFLHGFLTVCSQAGQTQSLQKELLTVFISCQQQRTHGQVYEHFNQLDPNLQSILMHEIISTLSHANAPELLHELFTNAEGQKLWPLIKQSLSCLPESAQTHIQTLWGQDLSEEQLHGVSRYLSQSDPLFRQDIMHLISPELAKQLAWQLLDDQAIDQHLSALEVAGACLEKLSTHDEYEMDRIVLAQLMMLKNPEHQLSTALVTKILASQPDFWVACAFATVDQNPQQAYKLLTAQTASQDPQLPRCTAFLDHVIAQVQTQHPCTLQTCALQTKSILDKIGLLLEPAPLQVATALSLHSIFQCLKPEPKNSPSTVNELQLSAISLLQRLVDRQEQPVAQAQAMTIALLKDVAAPDGGVNATHDVGNSAEQSCHFILKLLAAQFRLSLVQPLFQLSATHPLLDFFKTALPVIRFEQQPALLLQLARYAQVRVPDEQAGQIMSYIAQHNLTPENLGSLVKPANQRQLALAIRNQGQSIGQWHDSFHGKVNSGWLLRRCIMDLCVLKSPQALVHAARPLVTWLEHTSCEFDPLIRSTFALWQHQKYLPMGLSAYLIQKSISPEQWISEIGLALPDINLQKQKYALATTETLILGHIGLHVIAPVPASHPAQCTACCCDIEPNELAVKYSRNCELTYCEPCAVTSLDNLSSTGKCLAGCKCDAHSHLAMDLKASTNTIERIQQTTLNNYFTSLQNWTSCATPECVGGATFKVTKPMPLLDQCTLCCDEHYKKNALELHQHLVDNKVTLLYSVEKLLNGLGKIYSNNGEGAVRECFHCGTAGEKDANCASVNCECCKGSYDFVGGEKKLNGGHYYYHGNGVPAQAYIPSQKSLLWQVGFYTAKNAKPKHYAPDIINTLIANKQSWLQDFKQRLESGKLDHIVSPNIDKRHIKRQANTDALDLINGDLVLYKNKHTDVWTKSTIEHTLTMPNQSLAFMLNDGHQLHSTPKAAAELLPFGEKIDAERQPIVGEIIKVKVVKNLVSNETLDVKVLSVDQNWFKVRRLDTHKVITVRNTPSLFQLKGA